MQPIDFSKSTEVNKYFDEVLKSLQGVKITAIFTLCASFGTHEGYRTYMEDTEVYILFENEECLVVEYPFIDALSVNLRKLSEEEKKAHEESILKDFFNDCTDVHNFYDKKLRRNETISLEYDSLVSVKLEKVTQPYAKWIGGGIDDEFMPLDTTFEKMVFAMANGNTFVICPAAAELDGYTLVWSEDAQETMTDF